MVGIVSPAMVGVVPSIEMVIWVAVGGRGTLVGPVLGALLVNGAKSGLSESFPLIWQYLPGRHVRRLGAALPRRASSA